jgi:hypothetical protein
MDRDADAVKDQNWAIVDPGSSVVTADGEDFGTVREKMPSYLVLRAPKSLLEDVEMYIPRDAIDRIDGDRLVLRHTADQLRAMDLTSPPAVQAES